jgi:predicted DNA-binding transcriptional regulator AlpA
MSTEVNRGTTHQAPPLNDIMLLAEVAELTRLPQATLRFYRHRGYGGPRSFKLGDRVVFKRSDVEQWIAAEYAKAQGGNTAA